MLCIMRLHSSIIFIIPGISLLIMRSLSDMPGLGEAAEPGASCACSAGESPKPIAAASTAMESFVVFLM